MSLSNKKINISTTGDVYSINYSINLSNNKSLVCKYSSSNNNSLIDKNSIKYIDNIILSNGYTDTNELLEYYYKIPFNIIYNLFNDITYLPENIFKNCTTLNSVSQIPDNYTKICNSAFSGCYNLSNINLPESIIELGDYAFDGCKLLKSLNVSNIHKIGTRTFAGTGIKTINLNENVNSLPPFVFTDCQNLKTFNFNNELMVYEGAFAGCTSLTSVNIENYIGTISKDSDIILYQISENEEELNDNIQVKSEKILSNYIFAGCKKLDISNNVSFIDKIEVIGAGSLMNCINLKNFNNDIIIVNKFGFKDCSNLEYINLTNCQNIGDYAFKNCKSLSSVDLSNLNSLDSKSVFENCLNLKNISSLNSSIKKIGDNCFKNCKSLLDFDFTNIEEIGNQSFFGCESLGLKLEDISNDNENNLYGKNISINITENINNNSEVNNNHIICEYISDEDGNIQILNNDFIENNETTDTKIELDLSNVNKIGDYAFANCLTITNIKFKNVPIELGIGSFMNCISLKTVELPLGITNFTPKLFNNCSSLKSIKFNSGIEDTIELSGLSDCNKINSIIIPESDRYKVIDNKVVIDKSTNTIIYVVKDLTILEINSEYGDNIKIDDNAFNNSNISILNITEDVKSPIINEKTFANIINNNFHVLMSKNDLQSKRYLNILGKNKIYYI